MCKCTSNRCIGKCTFTHLLVSLVCFIQLSKCLADHTTIITYSNTSSSAIWALVNRVYCISSPKRSVSIRRTRGRSSERYYQRQFDSRPAQLNIFAIFLHCRICAPIACTHLVMANCPHTIGVEFGTRIIEVAGQKIKLQIWDTGECKRTFYF